VDQADANAKSFEPQPWKKVRWEVIGDEENFVPSTPGDAIGQEVKSIGSTIPQDYFIRRSSNQASQRTFETRRNATESL